MNKLIDDIKLFGADNPWVDGVKLEEVLRGTQSFDLALLGLEGEFSVYNDRLVDFILNSKYEMISMCVAHILRKEGIRKAARTYYQPAQDYLAELFGKDSNVPLGIPEKSKLTRLEYCETIVEALRAVDRHIAEGKEMGLLTEMIYLHDEIFGVFMNRYDQNVLKAAQAFFAVMDENEAFSVRDYNEYLAPADQSPAYYASLEESMNYFYQEVDYIRENFLPEGWLEDGSLPMLYIIAHAERCLMGKWYEV